MKYPFLRQLFVVTSAQLAVVTCGGVIGFPSILLQQFKQSDSLIKVDFHTESWIAAVPGMAGVAGIFIPHLMQKYGRKFGFRLISLLMIIGCVIIYFAKSSLVIIIGELFQGVGSKSMTVITFTTLSEMTSPKFRNKTLALYGIAQVIGITLVHVLGWIFTYKTLCIYLSGPILVAYLLSFIWPESPFWLAYVGKFEESKKSFIWLRGKDEEAQREMNELLNSQRVFLSSRTSGNQSRYSKKSITDIWTNVFRRDFYLPTLHILILISCYYFSGNLTVIVYAINLIEKVTIDGDTAFLGTVFIDIFVIIGNIACPLFLKYFDNKSVLLAGGIGSSIFLVGSSTVSYLQTLGVISNDSLLCLIFLTFCMMFSSFGLYCVPFCLATEIIPLRHRGFLNSLYILFICIFYFTTIKIAPYLILYLSVHGLLLTYAILLSISLFHVWKYVPETNNKTLQSIELYYINKKEANKNYETEIMDTKTMLPLTITGKDAEE
ncbi:uncharacterized protein LOC116766224 [Danaus plexippus]|uniref:uncharacterized protein LOC116766224 n=1 Tax=Danaus plexippus TaxID=13037 RepID=UPI002AB088AB|nr:uncharacterized protein LOC116766224 [Danaus plexippus]